MLPTDAQKRKDIPLARGLLDYFPLACAAIAEVSRVGNEQHNPGKPMFWDRTKSTDHADCILRHLIERGKIDTDGSRHTAKVAWRALALLETELEKAAAAPVRPGSYELDYPSRWLMKNGSYEWETSCLYTRAELEFSFRSAIPIRRVT